MQNLYFLDPGSLAGSSCFSNEFKYQIYPFKMVNICTKELENLNPGSLMLKYKIKRLL